MVRPKKPVIGSDAEVRGRARLRAPALMMRRYSGQSRSTPPPGKQSKWQPLSTVDPNPIGDNDPFSLGDSEDEKETKGGDKAIKMEDSERLKQATADAMADSLVDKKSGGGKS